MDVRYEPITARQHHWRTEVIVVMRRLGLTVPLWVEQFGDELP